MLIMLFNIYTNTLAQSPFNYGKNKHVYFISQAQRAILGIDIIYSIDQHALNNLGGMNNNWDVSVISLDSSGGNNEWFPMYLDSTFQFNYDTLTNLDQCLNGTEWRVVNNRLVYSGGYGYGSFDNSEYHYLSDTIATVDTYCSGHCGNQPLRSSKHVFNHKGLLKYVVHYPMFESEYEPEYEINFETETDYERYFNILIDSSGNTPDTTYFTYDKNGLLISYGRGNYLLKQLETYVNQTPHPFLFHQCYIGEETMEKFISKKLKYTPDIILIEICNTSVLTFVKNKQNKKYYINQRIVLE